MGKTSIAPSTRSLASQIRQHPLLTLREEMDDMLNRFFGSGEEGWLGGAVCPAADVVETDNALEIVLDLPGINPEEIDLHLMGNTLTIRAERKAVVEEKGSSIHRAERRRGKIARAVTLPCPVVEEEVAAEYKDGVLTVTLPKCQEARSRKIAVKH